MLYYILSFVIIFSSLSGNCLSLHPPEKCMPDREKVNIQVFYESLCNGCRHEFSRTLVPLINQLQDQINLQIYPYGNAKTISPNKFRCQHGPAECHGNKLHACALFKLNITLAVSYISCMMTEAQVAKKSQDEAALICATSRDIDYESIRQCAMSDLGNMLHLEAGLVSSAAKLKYVPFVLVNGKPVSGDLGDAVRNALSQQPSGPPPARLWRRRNVLL